MFFINSAIYYIAAVPCGWNKAFFLFFSSNLQTLKYKPTIRFDVLVDLKITITYSFLMFNSLVTTLGLDCSDSLKSHQRRRTQ